MIILSRKNNVKKNLRHVGNYFIFSADPTSARGNAQGGIYRRRTGLNQLGGIYGNVNIAYREILNLRIGSDNRHSLKSRFDRDGFALRHRGNRNVVGGNVKGLGCEA